MTYQEFIANKHITDAPSGFDPGKLPDFLFPFQADVVRWACRRGRAALLEDCGLGKTPQTLVWSHKVLEHTGKNVLIAAPLGVCNQFVREGAKFGIEVTHARSKDSMLPGINVTNYERLHLFDFSDLGGFAADESSILKNYAGKTRNQIIELAALVPHRLACSATAAPNDFMELGNHAEYLGVMTRTEMLATFFAHDGGETSKWRLKGHAENEFWRWMCSWAVNIRRPSDLGYDDGDFILPPLRMHEHVVQSTHRMDGYLFALPASSLKERRDARRVSLSERVDLAAQLATSNDEQWVFFCNLNAESEAIAKTTHAAEVRGSTTELEREHITMSFIDGTIRHVVTKPSLWGFGLNLQHCHNTAFVGLSDSYEEFYQCVRRFWRFGQKHPVDVHVIISDLEGAVLANIKRKEADASRLSEEMVRHMSDISSKEIKGAVKETETYSPEKQMIVPAFL